MRATQPGAWRPPWERLLDDLTGSVPPDWLVLGTADRGLYARWLYQRIVACGWHPFLRIQQGGSFRPVGQTRFRPLTRAVPAIGRQYGAVVDCFSSDAARLRCTLVACWEADHTDPWLIVTDLPVREAEARWYGLRVWIEALFKDLKRDGWQWQATRMDDPARAERLWLALAVASIWVVSVGGAAEATQQASGLADGAPRRPAARQVSCFQRGLLALLQAALRGEPLPLGRFVPEPWAARHEPDRLLLPPSPPTIPYLPLKDGGDPCYGATVWVSEHQDAVNSVAWPMLRCATVLRRHTPRKGGAGRHHRQQAE